MVTGKDGAFVLYSDQKKREDGAAARAPAPARAPSTGDYREFWEFQAFQRWRESNRDTPEYREFREWQEWKAYRAWKRREEQQ